MALAESKVDTVTVPLIGTESPAMLYRAADDVLRVVVRNNGGSMIAIAHDSSTLTQLGAAGKFLLPQGASEVFVLMPKQVIVAVAIGIAGQVSYAVSVAIPTLKLES